MNVSNRNERFFSVHLLLSAAAKYYLLYSAIINNFPFIHILSQLLLFVKNMTTSTKKFSWQELYNVFCTNVPTSSMKSGGAYCIPIIVAGRTWIYISKKRVCLTYTIQEGNLWKQLFIVFWSFHIPKSILDYPMKVLPLMVISTVVTILIVLRFAWNTFVVSQIWFYIHIISTLEQLTAIWIILNVSTICS